MLKRLIERLLARSGFCLVPLRRLEDERAEAARLALSLAGATARAAAGERAFEALRGVRMKTDAKLVATRAQRARAIAHGAGLERRLDELKLAHAILFRERKKLAQDLTTAQAKRAEAASVCAGLDRRLDDLKSAYATLFRERKKLTHVLARAQAELQLRADLFEVRRASDARAQGRLEAENAALRAETTGASDAAANRILEAALPPSGLSPRGMFDAARAYQEDGALDLAVAAYRSVGPELPALLAGDASDTDGNAGPDFLIIGAARAGTTWLRKQLSRHPDVQFLDGEPNYFSAHVNSSPSDYISAFSVLNARHRAGGAGSPGRFGDKSPSYLGMPERHIALCAALFPRLRLICLVREPVSRALSHMKHAGLALAVGDASHVGVAGSRLEGVVRAGRYREQLMRWAAHFAPEQILLIDFARLASAPAQVCREALAHIDAPDAKSFRPQVSRPPRQTAETPPPAALLDYLAAAYADEAYGVTALRQAMAEAAAGCSPLRGPGAG